MLAQHLQYDRMRERRDEVPVLLTQARQALASRHEDATDMLDRAIAMLTLSFPSRIVSSFAGGAGDATQANDGFSDETLEHSAEAPPTPAVVHGREEPQSQDPAAPPVASFRRFTMLRGSRTLLCDGVAVDVGSRAFDLLDVLVASKGAVVSKAELFKKVWPSMIVEESNLRFQMACLRKALGEDRDVIKTVPGRGYLLTSESTQSPQALASASSDGAQGQSTVAGNGVAAPTSKETRVVVIDDDSETRETLMDLLRSVGLNAMAFASIQMFRENSQSGSCDCLVLNAWLPGESGLDFQSELARAGSRVPLIFLSTHADVPMAVRAMKGGAADFLIKPVRYQEFVAAVHEALRRRRGVDEPSSATIL